MSLNTSLKAVFYTLGFVWLVSALVHTTADDEHFEPIAFTLAWTMVGLNVFLGRTVDYWSTE